MAPFWSGIAIGIAIGLPILLLAWIVTLFLGVWLGIAEGIRTGEFKRAWAEGEVRAANLRERLMARNERQRQWLVRHRVPPRVARWLTTPLFGSARRLQIRRAQND
jgi:uncharacterized membrane protein YhiD involved in acid resistance